jgi:hypothetical protein
MNHIRIHMNTIILLIISLLVLTPTMAYAMTPAQDGKWQGKTDALGNVRDSIDACSKYSGIYSGAGKYNDSVSKEHQQY